MSESPLHEGYVRQPKSRSEPSIRYGAARPPYYRDNTEQMSYSSGGNRRSSRSSGDDQSLVRSALAALLDLEDDFEIVAQVGLPLTCPS